MPAAKKTTETPADPVDHTGLADALAAFQAEMPTVHKGKTADTGKYTYKYADLADVASAAHPVLARHGLSFAAKPQHVDGLGFVLVGILRHSSGEYDEGMLPIQGRDAQSIGSSLTYNRRYLLGCMTGIVTDEDDDGSRAAKARESRPASDVQPSQAQGGQRQQGRNQPPPAEPQDGPQQPAGPDASVVKAQTIAATTAADLNGLRAAWDQACQSGAVNSTIPDPDADQSGVTCTLGDYIERRRQQMVAAEAPAA